MATPRKPPEQHLPAGRPSLYRPEYCERVVSSLEKGASLTSFAAEIGVSRATIYEWEAVHPEFSDACARARAKAGLWWETLLRRAAMKNEGNVQAILFGVKNMARDDWAERQAVELTGKDGGPIQTEDTGARDKLAAILARLAAAQPEG